MIRLVVLDKRKHHKNSIEISIIARKNFIVYNSKKYNKFKCLNFRDNSVYIIYQNWPRPSNIREFGFSIILIHEGFFWG